MSDIQPYGSPYQAQAVATPQASAPYGWGPGQVVTDRQVPDTALVVVGWVLAVVTVGYMLPWAVAVSRGKANHGPIALINVLLGWSLIGWIVALVMACQAHQVISGQGTMNVVMAQQFPNAQFAGAPSAFQTGPVAGWYPSPDGIGQRYWDGQAWTDHTAP